MFYSFSARERASHKKYDLFQNSARSHCFGLYDNGLVDDEEFVLLNDAFTLENLPFPYYKYPEVSLEKKTNMSVLQIFE